MDSLIYGLIVTLFGLAIVFSVLISLWGILAAMRVLFNEKNKHYINQNGVHSESISALEQIASTKIQTENADADELTAVVSAAIAVCIGNKSGLIVTKITRASENTPIWNKIGRQEQALNRL